MTQGAVSGVPISGVPVAYLTGQATCPGSLATGAGKSEPHRHPGRHRGSGTAMTGSTEGAARCQGVPRVHGARVYPGCAHLPSVDECIYGVPVRPGQARAGARPVPGPVHDQY